MQSVTEWAQENFGQIEGVGPTGDVSGQGFLLHNALMVRAVSGEIIGAAGQSRTHSDAHLVARPGPRPRRVIWLILHGLTLQHASGRC